jgi:hypothetical protein
MGGGLLVACAVVAAPHRATGEEPAAPQSAPAAELNDLERAFVEQMTGAALVGVWSVDGREGKTPASERYAISKVVKLKDDHWIVQARVTFGDIDVPVPVPVKMHWAGDTPVLSVTDLAIPLIGSEFTARVMFYDGRYAATWQHGKVGGHMWGRIEKAGAEPAKPAGNPYQPAPERETRDSSR